MNIKLNKKAYDHAVDLIKNKLEVEHAPSYWEEAKPTRNDEVRFLDTHSLEEYGSWFLGIDLDADQKSHETYHYPFGDLQVLHVGALHASKKAAEKHGHDEIVKAIDQLLKLIEEYK